MSRATRHDDDDHAPHAAAAAGATPRATSERGERRAWLRARLFVGALLGVALVGAARQLWTRDLGLDERRRRDDRVVVAVDTGGAAEEAGVRVGDVIVRDPAGAPPRGPATERDLFAGTARLSRAYAAGRVPIVVRRDGATIDVEVRPRSAPDAPAVLRQLRRAGPVYVPFLAFASMAVVLLCSPPPRDGSARRLVACALACFAVAFGLNWPQGDWPAWLLVLCNLLINGGVPTALALLAWYAWTAPRRAPVTARRWAAPAIAVVAATGAVSSFLDAQGVIRSPLPGNQGQMVADLVLLGALLVGLGWQRRHARAAVHRRQVDVLLGTFAACALLAVVALAIARGPLASVPLNVVFVACALVPVGFAVSVTRHRLFDLDAIALRAGAEVVVTGTSLLLFAVLGATVGDRLAGTASHGLPTWLGVAFVVVASAPLRWIVDGARDRLLQRDRRAFLARCHACVAALVDGHDLDGVRAVVRARLEAREVRSLDAVEVADADLAQLRAEGALHTAELRDGDLADRLIAGDLDALVWLPVEGSRVQAIALTLPLSPGRLGPDEREALASVGRAAAVSMRQHRAQGTLRSRVTTCADARRQMAMELHDGIGATLAAARVTVQFARRATSIEHATRRWLDEIDRILGEGLADLRLALYSVDDAHRAWPDVHARIRRCVGDTCAAASIEVEVNVEGEWSAEAPPALRLALLRLAQEATTNVVRHARARRVRCDLVGHADQVELRVEDDGVGIDRDDGPRDAPSDGGNGLRNMRRRALDLGGTLRLERPAGGGTRLVATVPLPGGAGPPCGCVAAGAGRPHVHLACQAARAAEGPPRP